MTLSLHSVNTGDIMGCCLQEDFYNIRQYSKQIEICNMRQCQPVFHQPITKSNCSSDKMSWFNLIYLMTIKSEPHNSVSSLLICIIGIVFQKYCIGTWCEMYKTNIYIMYSYYISYVICIYKCRSYEQEPIFAHHILLHNGHFQDKRITDMHYQ